MKTQKPNYWDFYQASKSTKNRYCWFLVVFIATLVVMPAAFAQQNQKEQKFATATPRSDTDYYLVVYFDYKPGKAGEAFSLIEKYFIPVDKEAERFVIQFRPLTGSWDEIAFFPLEIGPKALAYSVSPSDAMWNATFVKQVGSQTEVGAIWKKFQSLVKRIKTELVLRPMVYK